MTQDNRKNTNFPFELARRLADIKWATDFDFLYYHQNIARVYFNDEQTRGLLIYHGTGMGKSILAASLAMDAMFPPADVHKMDAQKVRSYPARRVIVLLAKSLANNMRSAVRQYIKARIDRGGIDALGSFGALAALPSDKQEEWITRNFSFVTMNASNMITQMSRAAFISENDEDMLFDVKAAELSETVADLNDKLLIIDEAHNFFRAIVNGSRNSARLYDLIMNARNLKLAFLTGTPIASHPFETTVCFNMLAGEKVLPVHFDDFMRMFVADTAVKNRGKFQNRIFGLVSFVNYASSPGIGTSDINNGVPLVAKKVDAVEPQNIAPTISPFERAKQHVEFPEEYPMVVVRVTMTPDQYDAYIIAREQEKSEGLSKASRGGASIFAPENFVRDASDAIVGGKVKIVIKQPQRFHARETQALQKPKSEFSSSYRVHSRQISNYCPPPAIRNTLQEKKDDDISVPAILDMIGKIESAKFSAILERVNAHRGQLGLIYSQFVGLGGLSSLARFLDQNGYRDNYAIISGEVPVEERSAIIARFSEPTNMYAEHIALLLVSSTGAEGIDLKNVRHVHILEPYWNLGRIKQVKARAIRNGSHIDLPPNERNVATYMYVAIAPEATAMTEATAAPQADNHSVPTEPTSDEQLYTSARKSQLLIDSFESAIHEVSIECAINHTATDRPSHCRICAPSGTRLFTDNIDDDVNGIDPCNPIASRRVTAQKINVGAETFYYTIAQPNSIESRLYGYEIFIEDPKIRAWRKIAVNDARYAAVATAIAGLRGTRSVG